MYQALYRSQRPEVFSEVLGQEHIVKILKNQVAQDKVGHAYLFCGTRGTGKTTMARIMAKAVNCIGDAADGRPCGVCPNCRSIQEGTFIDMIEIDAASNNGVENVRELRESVNYPPAVGRRKVYIIDEVHMLSVPAFNALLKTLEEPPENVMFILATTDPQKLPQTILSRCLRLDFRRVPEQQIAERMADICASRGVAITREALGLLSANSDGSVRDGLSLLDQCLAGADGTIDRELVLENLGTVSEEFFIKLTELVMLKNSGQALLMLDSALREGRDVKQIMNDWLAHYRNLLIAKYIKDSADMLNMSEENAARLAKQSDDIPLKDINESIITLARLINDARYSTLPRVLMELAIITLANGLGESVGPVIKAEPAQTRQRAGADSAPDSQSDETGAPEAPERPSDETVAPEAPERPSEAKRESELPSEETGAEQRDATDFDDIWDRVWDAVGDQDGSVYLVRINTRLAGISDTEFKVIVSNDFIKEIAERNRELITSAMERVHGKRLHMVMRHADGDDFDRGDEGGDAFGGGEAAKTDAGELAAELTDKFHLSFRVE